MGIFHCPVGAVCYKGFGCIECGMCIAATKEDIVKATEIIRRYVQANGSRRAKSIEKIAVCGKGGSGKSTISAMVASSFARMGYLPLVLDTDDSNAGLAKKLGISEPPLPLIRCLERFSIGENAPPKDWLIKDPLRISEIPPEFIVQRAGISLMLSGKIENPLQGCSCNISDLTKQLVQNLELDKREKLIVDHDAGIESFGRGEEQGVDTVIIVVEPSFDSIDLAEKIKYLSEGLGIRRIRALINKAADADEIALVREMLSEREIRYLGALTADRNLAACNLRGQEILATQLQSAVDKIMMLMLDEAEMGYKKPSTEKGGM